MGTLADAYTQANAARQAAYTQVDTLYKAWKHAQTVARAARTRASHRRLDLATQQRTRQVADDRASAVVAALFAYREARDAHEAAAAQVEAAWQALLAARAVRHQQRDDAIRAEYGTLAMADPADGGPYPVTIRVDRTTPDSVREQDLYVLTARNDGIGVRVYGPRTHGETVTEPAYAAWALFTTHDTTQARVYALLLYRASLLADDLTARYPAWAAEDAQD